MQVLCAFAGHIIDRELTRLKKQWFKGMKKLFVEVKVIANGMHHQMAEVFLQLQVFLAAIITEMTREGIATVKAIAFGTVMLFHL